MTEAFASLPSRARAAVSQRDAGVVLRAVRSGAVPSRGAGARTSSATLAGRADLALGDSEYNRAELEALGFDRTGVFPIAVDTARITRRSARPALERHARRRAGEFPVRRPDCAEQEDRGHHQASPSVYKRYVDAYYRFIFVGRFDVVPRYYSMIRALMAEYRLLDDRFVFTGPVPDEELAVYYRHAAVYISMSEHEGFCVPLVEAMAADVPVLAYAAAAVPDTLGGAGVQFAPKDLEVAAELLGALAFDDRLRAEVIAGQRRRLADFGDARHLRAISPRSSHTLS